MVKLLKISTFFFFFLFAQNGFGQNKIKPLEPVAKYYKTLGRLNAGPVRERASMDTIVFPWTEYSAGTSLTNKPLIYLSAKDSAQLHKEIHFPANSSEQTWAELDYLLKLQNSRTKSEIDTSLIIALVGPYPIVNMNLKDSFFYENAKKLFFIANSVGEWFNIDNFPATAQLVSNCLQDIRITEFFLKRYFKRSRPYQLDSRLQPLQQIPTPAFPSGHTLWAYGEALVFSEIIPEKRNTFLELADQVRWSREILGIHYPSDNEAARVIAWHLLKSWYHNPVFISDLEKAKKEWQSKKGKF
jgi:acid phosphatase (class A)